ncbi:MAG TPA: capsule assembly Wzi family protein [Candidatus Acidoferrales bacterium]|nr:capsule assembly Wzi family protein [Candidatus Acidoferrales bacterium]
MNKSFFVVSTFAFVFAGVSFAQHNSSIPVDSWIYEAIRQLQTRGYLLELSPGFKPYRRLEVEEALRNFEKKVDVSTLPRPDQWLIKKLDSEFSYETKLVNAEKENPDTSFTGVGFSEEAFFNLAKGDYKTFKHADKTEFRPTLRSEFGFDIGNHLLLYTDATVDQTLRDDTLYTGTTKFGLKALHQQAYVQYSDRYVDLTFGRDYLSWGYGNDGAVLVSPTAGAFDMISALVKTHVVKFNWFVAQLNQMYEYYPDTNSYMPVGARGTTGPLVNRYFTGSRVEFNICDKVFLGAYQAATFGGVNAPIDLEDINPVRVTYETETNDQKDLNTFLGFDFSMFWPKNLNPYGDLMIDDWQVDHKTIGDLKPNLYAFDIGLRASNILENFGVSGTDANLQYMMVRNRVYNEYDWASFEKLLLRNYPIAVPYGDDFWNIDLRLSHWLTYNWKFGIEVMHIEHGNQNIYGPYTMPWLTDPNITVQTGYSEPFPYRVIQETNLFGANVMYQPQANLYGRAMISYSQNRNYRYAPGIDKGVISFLVTIYYDFATAIQFK